MSRTASIRFLKAFLPSIYLLPVNSPYASVKTLHEAHKTPQQHVRQVNTVEQLPPDCRLLTSNKCRTNLRTFQEMIFRPFRMVENFYSVSPTSWGRNCIFALSPMYNFDSTRLFENIELPIRPFEKGISFYSSYRTNVVFPRM